MRCRLRTARVRQPGRYLAAAQPADRVAESGVVAAADLPFEFCLNALRLREGFDPACFESRTGQSRDVLAPALARAQAQGLLAPDAAGRWVPTELGRRFLNDLQAMFLPDPGGAPEAEAAKPLASPAGIG
jgi:coproporphyrinogen III oxidase-like Fe-S oxidoreductase